MNALAWCACRARWLLVAGLVVGIAVPSLASLLRPWIAELIAALLFVAALRVGSRAVGGAQALVAALGIALLLQLALPLLFVATYELLALSGPLLLGLTLMLAASPISGSANLALMTGADGGTALRQLVVGTLILPLTAPLVLAVAGFGEAGTIANAGLRLFALVGGATLLAFAARLLWREQTPSQTVALDGAGAILMAVVVIGLMDAVGPALTSRPEAVAATLVAATAANYAMQMAVAFGGLRQASPPIASALGIIAGNRNVALFLAALPTSVTDPLLLFIGCYQVPMYLTPAIMGPVYARLGRRA